MALTLSAQDSRLLVPASAAHDTLAAFTVGLWFRGSARTTNARMWSKSAPLRLTSSGTTGDLRSVMDVVEATPDILNATSTGAPAPGGTTWWCLIVEQSLADGVRIYVGDETTLPAEVTYSDRTAGDPLLTVTNDSANQFRFGGTGTGSVQTQAGDYSYCMRLNRVATAQERENWWRTLALPTDGSVIGDWRPGENALIDVPDHGPLGLDLVLSGTISETGADPTLPGPSGNLAGTAAGTSTATGTLTGIGALAGTASGTATATATLTGSGALAGTAAGTSTASGTLVDGTPSGAISGTAAGTSTASGALTGIGALAGTATGTSAATGSLTGTGSLAGTAIGTSTAGATITGLGFLSGTASGGSTASGTLTGIGALAGTSSGTSTATGFLTAFGVLTGTASGTSTATGTLSDATAAVFGPSRLVGLALGAPSLTGVSSRVPVLLSLTLTAPALTGVTLDPE